MKKYILVLLMVFLCILSLVFAVGAQESSDKTYDVRVAIELSKLSPNGQAVNGLGELLEKNSNGRFKATTFTDGEIGKERDLLEMLRQGSIEVTTAAASTPAAYVPQMALFESPYTAGNTDELVSIFNKLCPYVAELLAPFNLKPMGSIPMGFRVMINKVRPIYMPEDLEGLKMRAPALLFAEMFKALGSTAIIMSWSELYTSLKTGVVDGAEGPISLIYQTKLYEVAKYLSITNHIPSAHYFIVNKSWYDALPSDLKLVFDKSIEEASQIAYNVEKEQTENVMEEFSKTGAIINNVKDPNAFREKLSDWKQKYVNEKGAAWVDLYQKMLSK